VTPKATAPVVLWLFCFVWLFWLRVLMLGMFLSFGALPQTGG
jgi:YggT family protein